MTILYLAAGYATRLYPLTKDFPKPLLKIGDKTILSHLADDIESSAEIAKRVIVTNSAFAPFFRGWASAQKEEYIVCDDGTTSNETRLGAVRDILFAIENASIYDDLFILAGDNVLDFSLAELLSFAKEKGTSCVMRFFQPEREKLRKTGVAVVDENDRILSMEEKPAEPTSRRFTFFPETTFCSSRRRLRTAAARMRRGASSRGLRRTRPSMPWRCRAGGSISEPSKVIATRRSTIAESPHSERARAAP